MDFKSILSKLDGISSKPVEGVADVKKISSIISEGASPHGVSLPVQMAMQHYSQPIEKPKPSLLRRYIAEAEESYVEKQSIRKQQLNKKARLIAEKVLEHTIPGHSMGFTGGVGPGLMPNESIENKPDIVKMDIPLLMRLLEYAREDAKTDMDLHNVAEKLTQLSEQGDVLTMAEYDAIVGEQKLLEPPRTKKR